MARRHCLKNLSLDLFLGVSTAVSVRQAHIALHRCLRLELSAGSGLQVAGSQKFRKLSWRPWSMVMGVFCLKVVETGEQSKCHQAARFGGEGIQGNERHSWIGTHWACKAVHQLLQGHSKVHSAPIPFSRRPWEQKQFKLLPLSVKLENYSMQLKSKRAL